MGKRPANDPLGILTPKKQQQQQQAAPAQTPANDPLGILKPPASKKKDGGYQPTGGLDVSPAANYKQTLSDFTKKSEELNEIQNNLLGLKDLIDKQPVMEGDPQKLQQFKDLSNSYKKQGDEYNKRLSELQRMQVLLKQNKDAYMADNKSRQDKLFKSLNLTKEQERDLRNKIYKDQHPEDAADVDAGRLVPTSIDVDADDLAKALTGKTMSDIERMEKVQANRTISDRVFGSFKRSVEKTLAFEFPAAVAGSIQNALGSVRIDDKDLEKSWFAPGAGNQFKKAIALIPGAKEAVNSAVDGARFEAFNWAQNLKNSPIAVSMAGGVPIVFQNDENLIKSISQIKRPLDVVDFIFSNAGQGVAQIVPSILTRGASSMIQEIGNNQIEGTIEIAQKMGITPEEVIRKGLDEPVLARNYGIIQGALDALGAGKVAKAVGAEAVKKDLKEKAIRWFEEARKAGQSEFLTEGAQGAIGQIAVGDMKGLGKIQAVKNIDWFQVFDEALAGFVGGTVTTAAGTAASAVMDKMAAVKGLSEKTQKAPEEQVVYQDFMDTVADVAKKYGDPRSKEEIKQFIEKDVLSKIPSQGLGPIDSQATNGLTGAQNDSGSNVETLTSTQNEEGNNQGGQGRQEGLLDPQKASEQQAPLPVAPVDSPDKAIEEFKVANPEAPKGTISDKEKVIASMITRFPMDSWRRFGDPNYVKDTKVMRMMYLSKKGTDLDQQAQDMSLAYNPMGDGTEITPQDIIDFVMRFPQGKRQFNALNAKEAEEMAQSFMDEQGGEETFFNANPDLEYALKSIAENGLTLESLQDENVQKFLDNNFLFTEQDKENIKTIFEYAREEGIPELSRILAEINQRTTEDFGKGSEVPGVQAQESAATEKVNELGFPESWSQNAVQNAEDPALQANPPSDAQPANAGTQQDTLPPPTGPRPATQPDIAAADRPATPARPAVKKSEKVKKDLDDLISQLDKTLGSSLNSIVNPEAAVIGAKIVAKYVELGATKFGEIMQDIYASYGEEAFNKYFQAIKAGYGSLLATSDSPDLTPLEEVRRAKPEDFKPKQDDTGTTGDLESNSRSNESDQQVGQKNVPAERKTGGAGNTTGGKRDAGTRAGQQGDLGFSDRIPPTGGERPDTGVDKRNRSTPVRERVGRGSDNTGSSATDDAGLQSEQPAAGEPQEGAGSQNAKRLSFEEKVKLQERANRTVKVVPMDKANIAESLPLLLPHQVENVFKAETRFMGPPPSESTFDVNKGILFTDGTGTGKTFTGLGIAKRYQRMGVKDILIVVPTDTKAKDWMDEARLFGMDISQLKSISDAGSPGTVVITTYANFRQNEALLNRSKKHPFGLVLYDEAHKIVSNADGSSTAADEYHKKLTMSPNNARATAEAMFKSQIKKEMAEVGAVSKATQQRIADEAKKLEDQTKVVFLSASPFSYRENISYADGYLFRIKEGIEKPYEAFKQFFVTNFGYVVRRNELNKPEADVDTGLMERTFHSKLMRLGAVSSTRIQLDKDYSREFILVDDTIGAMIDEGYKIASDRNQYKYIPALLDKKFTFLYKAQLLESIKSRQILDRIDSHINLGRKVVIFHTYVNSIPSHPFDFLSETKTLTPGEASIALREIEEFNKKYPQFHKMDLRGLLNPIKTFQKKYGDKVGIFNGTVPEAQRKESIRQFNKDNGNIDIIVIQMEAGKEGISLHDITGNRQRVLINVGLPYKPSDAIQSEGRIYRIGQMSDAIIEYPVLHLNFEKMAFASKINVRVGTVENLAFGEQSRNLQDSFKEGYKNATTDPPSENQGKGSRDADMQFDVIDEWDKAKTFYFARQKRNAKTKAMEGEDYFATPEPLGYKVVQWLFPVGKDRLLEPSAGHGAIARWFPDNTVNKFIEPSYNLKAELSINATGEVMGMPFEDLNIVNKFDGIAMNPPFGSNSKTAWEHLSKAMIHLADGGRVIAIVPDGPSMQKYIDKWLDSKDSDNFTITGKILLPSVTFERAGTKVRTQVLIIDKQTDPDVRKSLPAQKVVDLSGIEDIKELFDRIKDLEMPGRVRARAKTESVAASKESGPTSDVVAGIHTKYKYPIWTVKLNRMIDSSDYQKASAKAKQLDGYYSSFTGNGAIRGFVFKSEDNAVALSNFINNGFQGPPDDGGGRGPLSMLSAFSKGRTDLGSFAKRTGPVNEENSPIKLHKEVIGLAAKYNPNSTLGQGYNVRGSEGTFYQETQNIRVKGLTDLSVVMHELVHALDQRTGVIKNLIEGTKEGDQVRSRLTDVYEDFYPRAQRNHALRVRMVEGYATLVQKFIENPDVIKTKYPDLVNDFLTTGGKYFVDDIGTFIQDVTGIIEKYQKLSALDKMSARVVNDEITEEGKPFLTKVDKATTELVDKLWPIEKLAKQMGTHFTSDDLSLWMRLSNNALQIANKNTGGKKQRFWAMDESGNWSEKHNFNYFTILSRLKDKKLEDDFAAYLYARRIHFEYEELKDLEKKIDELNSPKHLAFVMESMDVDQDAAASIIQVQVQAVQDDITRLQEILANEGVTEEEVKEAYEAGKDMFTEEERMYDVLTQEDLEFAHNPMVQLLDDDGYDRFKKRKGYATFKRAFYDELVGDADVPKIQSAGKTKVGQFMTRRGSTKPILNPLLGAMMNHQEIMRKGMKQIVYNKFLEAAEKHPDLGLFQVLELQVTGDRMNRYPQERDNNIIMARKGYKRVPLLVSAEIKSVIDENYDFHNAHLLETTLTSLSQLFRAGTTGIFFQFFVNNTVLDQIAATNNTRNGLMPFISSFKQMGPVAMRALSRGALFPDSPESQYLKEYLFLAGTSQTFASADMNSLENMRDILKGEDSSFKNRLVKYFSNIAAVLSFPGNATEIMTRGTEYILARKAGKSQVVALEEAGRVSAPFHHVGRLGGGVGRSYVRSLPYFNASIQVLKQTKASLSTKEGRVRYAFTALSMVAASVTSMLYLLDQDDEDERKILLKSMPPDLISKYLFLPNPFSNKKLLQIRIPEQLGWLSGIVNMMLIESADQTSYKWSEYGEASLSFAPAQINPFNPAQMFFSYIPQAIKPAVEVTTGVKLFPSVRPIETERDKSLPPELRYNKYTSPLAIKMGEQLGWSPKKIDVFLEGYGGRAVKYITGKPGAFNFENIFNRELYMEASRQFQYFYEIKGKVSQNIKAYNDNLKTFTPEEEMKMFNVDALVSDIDGLLQDYSDIKDVEEYEPQAVYIRNLVFKKIKELEDMEY